MTKTLILAVDRDDDFGSKGGVETPLVGIDEATKAAVSLGIVDPEDSDINALFAAINIYHDLSEDGKDVEIALICGDRKVGHKSDSKLIDELNMVLDEIKPDRSILVGDGSEDEYVYPIISSRVPVDSVRKVFVKQSPGIEGSFYIFSKMLSDPQKRKRFLVPLGVLLFAIASVYITMDISAFAVSNDSSHLVALSAPLVIALTGISIILYGYNSADKVVNFVDIWVKQLRSSNVSMTFTILSIAMVLVGLVIGVYSIKNILSNGFIYVALIFVSNVVWPFAFAYFFNDLGRMLDSIVDKESLVQTFMTGSITVFGTAFIIQGAADFIRNYIGYGAFMNRIIFLELTLGILFTLLASIIHVSYNRVPGAREAEEDEV